MSPAFPAAAWLPSPGFLAALDSPTFGKTKWYTDVMEAARKHLPAPRRSDYDRMGEKKAKRGRKTRSEDF